MQMCRALADVLSMGMGPEFQVFIILLFLLFLLIHRDYRAFLPF